MKYKIVSCFTAMLMTLSLLPASAGSLTVYSVDRHECGIKDSYDWEYWNGHNIGDVQMTMEKMGYFECKWKDVEECIFKSGKKLGSTQTWENYRFMFDRYTYDIEYYPDGNSFIGYYGWAEDPLVEYYVVEAWGNWRPCSECKSKASFSSDGKEYDVYTVERINAPSIHGNETFEQYWSVAKENPAELKKLNKFEGTVSMRDHFEEWEKNDMKMGKMYEISMQVLSYEGSGYANIFPGIMSSIYDWHRLYDENDDTKENEVTDTSGEILTDTTEVLNTAEETAVTEISETAEETAQTNVTDISDETVLTNETDVSKEITMTEDTSNSSSQNEEVLYGDIDGNGVVELTDLTVLSVYLLGGTELSESQLIKADIYRDHLVDIADLARLKQYICKDPAVLEGGLLKTITDKLKSGNKDGYDWELWNDDDIGTAEMSIGSIGSYSCSWSNVRNCIFKSGKKLGCTKTADEYGGLTWTYDVDFSPNGNAYMGIYGWTEDPTVEYYIVESWGTWRPPGIRDNKGILQSDGRNYDVYTVTRYNQPSIHGTETYEQYWDVAQTNPACAYTKKNIKGSINISNHFRNWEKLGLRTGRLYEISFSIEAYDSSGSADIKQNRPYY